VVEIPATRVTLGLLVGYRQCVIRTAGSRLANGLRHPKIDTGWALDAPASEGLRNGDRGNGCGVNCSVAPDTG
jgi:hypothetical protein